MSLLHLHFFNCSFYRLIVNSGSYYFLILVLLHSLLFSIVNKFITNVKHICHLVGREKYYNHHIVLSILIWYYLTRNNRNIQFSWQEKKKKKKFINQKICLKKLIIIFKDNDLSKEASWLYIFKVCKKVCNKLLTF